MNKEVMDIINTLADKFGTTAQYLIAEMTRYYIVTGIVTVILMCLLTFALFKAAIYCMAEAKKDWTSAYEIYGIFAWVGFAFVLAFMCVSAVDVVGWIASPTASVIKKILEMI